MPEKAHNQSSLIYGIFSWVLSLVYVVRISTAVVEEVGENELLTTYEHLLARLMVGGRMT